MAIARKLTECSCEACKSMCRRSPCFPDPEGAQKLIDAGFKGLLRVSTYPSHLWGKPFVWPVVSPLQLPSGACVFHDENGLCKLHDLGLKPIEGKLAYHDQADDGLRRAICFKWASPEGVAVMKQFEGTEGIAHALQVMHDYKNKKP